MRFTLTTGLYKTLSNGTVDTMNNWTYISARWGNYHQFYRFSHMYGFPCRNDFPAINIYQLLSMFDVRLLVLLETYLMTALLVNGLDL